MSYRKIEIILLPDRSGKVRRFRVPGFLFAFLLFLFLSCVSILSWTIVDYTIIRSKARQVAQLEMENEDQRIELLEMSGRVMRIVDELDDLQAIDGEEEVILGLEEAYDDIQVEHMGDQIPNTFLSDRVLLNRYLSLVRQMHSALAYVESEIQVRAIRGRPMAKAALSIGGMKKGEYFDVSRGLSTRNRAYIRKKLRAIAMELGLAPRLALSMAKVESGYDHRAVSPKGAIGVLQLMPQFVCQEYEVAPEMLFDPEVNIRIGLKYMKALLKRFGEDVDLSLAAYNAGPRRVVEAGYGIPPIEETQEYVKKVREAMKDRIEDFLPKQIYQKQQVALRNSL